MTRILIICLTLMCLSLSASGYAFDRYTSSKALLIGTSTYTNGWTDLPGVAEDLAALEAFLVDELRFDVVEVLENPDRESLCAALFGFIDSHGGDENTRILIYFAGHGETVPATDEVLQVEQGCPQLDLQSTEAADFERLMPPAGFLVLPGSPAVERRGDLVPFVQSAIPFRYFRQLRERFAARHVMFAFDSCFSGAVFQERSGLRILYPGSRNPPQINSLWESPSTLYLTAGKEDQPVPDVSIFRRYFIEGLRGQADLDRDGYVLGSELAMFVRSEVTRQSDRTQEPQFQNERVSRADLGEMVFDSGLPPGPVEAATEPTAPFRGRSESGYDYLAVFSDDCPLCPEMIVLPPGRVNTHAARNSEGATDAIEVGGFAISKTEITNAQWLECYRHAFCTRALADFEPASARKPVLGVSRADALEYVEWLNAATEGQFAYRLPSDLEWTYAASAGSPVDELLRAVSAESTAVCDGCGGRVALPSEVGSLEANRFGIHDLLGNAWEWVADCAAASNAQDPESRDSCSMGWIRGGSFATPEEFIASDLRHAYPANRGFANVGFRVASDS